MNFYNKKSLVMTAQQTSPDNLKEVLIEALHATREERFADIIAALQATEQPIVNDEKLQGFLDLLKNFCETLQDSTLELKQIKPVNK